MSALAATATRLAFLADDTDVGDETHKAGPLALLIIVILCVACFVLFRSMSRHLRKVREQFPEDVAEAPPTTASPAAASPATSSPAPGSTRPAPKSRTRQDDTTRR